jgi:hypothetical protein
MDFSELKKEKQRQNELRRKEAVEAMVVRVTEAATT